MKKGKNALILFVGVNLWLNACSQQRGEIIQPAPTPEPKMAAQSANWKVGVMSITHDPKPEATVDTKLNPADQHDTLRLLIEIQYRGAEGEVESPAVFLDQNGQRLEGLRASLSFPKGSPLSITAEEAVDPDNWKMKETTAIIQWLESNLYKKKPWRRTLRNGEQLHVNYSFKDPKEYSNLKLVFADVAPITLEVSPVPKP